MPQFFKLANPGITSVSIDGHHHEVNKDGLLEVHTITPNLLREVTGHFAGVAIDPKDDEQMATLRQQQDDDEAERQVLFGRLDEALNRKTDRRRSLQQLRVQWADHQTRQARIAGAGAGTALTALQVP